MTWEILHVERWKEGVDRLHMRRVYPNGTAEFRIYYGGTMKLTELLQKYIELRNENEELAPFSRIEIAAIKGFIEFFESEIGMIDEASTVS